MVRPLGEITKNLLLRRLPADDYALLRPHLEPVDLKKGEVLIQANEPIAHVHFLESGLASIIAVSPEGQRIDAGMFGREGMSGLPILFGTDRTPKVTLIQIADGAQRLSADAFRGVLRRSPALVALLLRYAHAMSVQIAYTALSNGLHDLPERLARWILMCHDRTDGDEMSLTHDFLALMLGVRRPGVTMALHALEGAHLIKATRGKLTVRDRAGLEDFAADAYGIPEAEYERLIAPMSKRNGAVGSAPPYGENI